MTSAMIPSRIASACHIRVVLGRDDHRVHADGLLIDVLDSYLALAVRPEEWQSLVLSDFRKTGYKLVGVEYGHGHILRRLVACITEHETLIPGALLVLVRLVDAHGDVGGLFVYGDNDRASPSQSPWKSCCS